MMQQMFCWAKKIVARRIADMLPDESSYVNTPLDKQYRTPLPDQSMLPKKSLPRCEWELRKALADWLMTAFVPFNSLSWIDQWVSKKAYNLACIRLEHADSELRALINSGSEYKAALKRVLSVMPGHLPQKEYLVRNILN